MAGFFLGGPAIIAPVNVLVTFLGWCVKVLTGHASISGITFKLVMGMLIAPFELLMGTLGIALPSVLVWWTWVLIPAFWQVTIVPTFLAGVLFWCVIRALAVWLPWAAEKKWRWVLSLTLTSTVSSLIAWIAMPLARTSAFEMTPLVCGIGAVLGASFGAFANWAPSGISQNPSIEPAAELER
jgi:hypothetical protein